MSEVNTQFVDFYKYCKRCIHGKKDEVEEPCNSCLEIGAREGTSEPEYFKEKVK